MKERPILFSGAMVRAILSGQKTQTRRVVKNVLNNNRLQLKREQMHVLDERLPCPYGRPGDRLWVRESWQGDKHDFDAGFLPAYAATDARTEAGWKPSIHMPRLACRIVLEIVSVRVERLQDISEADAKAEGARYFSDIPLATPTANPNRWSMESPENTDQCLSSPKWAFANYFCKVNAKRDHDFRPWDANPWVWVVEFKRVAA